MLQKLIGAAVASLAMATSTPTAAQAYAGGALGQSRVNEDCGGAQQCDQKDTAYKVLAGYALNPNVGVELAYVDFGKFSASSTVPFLGGIGVSTETRGPALGVWAGLPVDAATFYVTGGVASLRTKATTSLFGARDSDTDTSEREFWGAGASYALTPTARVRVAWERYRVKFENTKAIPTLITAGAVITF